MNAKTLAKLPPQALVHVLEAIAHRPKGIEGVAVHLDPATTGDVYYGTKGVQEYFVFDGSSAQGNAETIWGFTPGEDTVVITNNGNFFELTNSGIFGVVTFGSTMAQVGSTVTVAGILPADDVLIA
jgi:hypothetical protein